MQLTIPTIAIAAATFAATLAFAPVITGAIQQFSLEQAPAVPVGAAAKDVACPPVAKIVAALGNKECL
jgi:hypothetical protein